MDLDPSTTLCLALKWHPIRDMLAYANFFEGKWGSVSFCTNNGGEPFFDSPRRLNERPHKILWHPIEPKLVVGWDSGRVSLIDLTERTEKGIVTEKTCSVTVLCWDSEAKTLLTGDVEGNVRYYDGFGQNEGIKNVRNLNIQGQNITCGCMKLITKKRANPQTLNTSEKENDEFNEILALNRKRRQETNEVSESEKKRLLRNDMEEVSVIFTDKSSVYLITNDGDPVSIYTADSPAKQVLAMSERQYVVVLSEGLMFYQLMFDGLKVDDKIKVKLSGKREFFNAIQVDLDTVAMCYGDREIRIWDLHTEDSAVYRIEQSKGYDDSESIISLAYCKKRNTISAGTIGGHIAPWKKQIENNNFSVDQQWKLQSPLSCGQKVVEIDWSAATNTLAVNSGNSVEVFKSQGLEYHVNGHYAVIKTSPQILSITKIIEPVETQELNFSYSIKGFRIYGTLLFTWDDKQVFVNSIEDSESTVLEVNLLHQFNAVCTTLCRYDQQLYLVEKGQLCVRTLQGTLKKTLSFREVEGEVCILDMNSKWLCVGSTHSYIRIYNVDNNDIKQQYQSNELAQNWLGFNKFDQIHVNSLGNKVSISIKKNAETVDDNLYVWDAETDQLGYFSFAEGLTDQQMYENNMDEQRPATRARPGTIARLSRPSTTARPRTTAARKIERDQSRYRMLGYIPNNHFWDQNDGRFLCCEATKLDSNQAASLLLTLFVTIENGIQTNDVQPKSSKTDSIIWVKVPFVYYLRNVSEIDEEDDITLEKSLSRLIIRRTLREFVGIASDDNEGIKAMMNFSFYLTAEQMDNAFQAIKYIKNDSVWDHMARMCVKTRRIDVAVVCLGHMRNARAVKAIKGSVKRGDDIDLQTAILAIELDMMEDAVNIYTIVQRYDLLNRLYQTQNNWTKAFEVASKYDRIHLRNTHYNFARYLESVGEIEQAIENFEKSQTHHFEVPRMLSEEPKAVDLYVKRKRERELYLWWARYLESVNDLEGARNYYKYGDDQLSVVRILCYHDRVEEAVEVINKTDDKAASFYLARYFESKGDVEKAVRYFEKASSYSSAIRLAKENGYNDQLANYALHAGGNELIETAKYYENMHGHVDKAVMLYHKAGMIGRALDLAFRTEQISALDPIIQELGPDSDPDVLERAAYFFAQNQREHEAVQLLVFANRFQEAVDMCLRNNVIIDERLADVLTPPRTDPNRKTLLTEIARCCLQQGNYHFAAKKYTQAGKKVDAMKALLRSGDTPKIILFSNTAKDKSIYRLAGNYLQSLNWKDDANLMKHIENCYIKASALDSLAGFYESCAQVEIDDYRDYEKGITAYNEALKCWSKKAEADGELSEKEVAQRENIKNAINKIEAFLDSKDLLDKDPGEALKQLSAMAEDKNLEQIVKTGDIYSILIVHNVTRSNWKKAHQLIQQYQNKRGMPPISDYISKNALDEICDKNGVARLNIVEHNNDEDNEMVEYSHALRRRISAGNDSNGELSD